MRRFSTFLALVLALSPLAARSATVAGPLTVSARSLTFYNDQYLLEGDGQVQVRMSDGTTISGDAFSMDVKANRFLVAGHVHLRSSGGNLDGAALSDFIDFNRVYFVPVISQPDRWTYLDGNYTQPAKGRQMPGDAFAFPEVHSQKTLRAATAVVDPRHYVRFSGVTSYIAGVGIPLPSYYVNFSSDPNLSQNSLSGSSGDITYNVTGNEHSITAVHARYDSINKFYGSVEQHFSGSHEYAVFSVNPLTRPDKYANLILEDRLGKNFEIRSFSQLHTMQSWLTQPTQASQFTYVVATQALPQSSLQAVGTFTNYNLLGPASLGPPVFNTASLNHPSSLQLTASSFPHRIAKTPFYEMTRLGYGFYHDSYLAGPTANPVQYQGTTYVTNYNRMAGFTLYTPTIKLGNKDNSYKTYIVTATYDQQRQWYSVPHYVDNINANASLSRTFSQALNSYVQYGIVQTNDIYAKGGYGDCVVPANTPPLCYAGFLGKATLRTTTLGINFAPSPSFYAGITARHHDDFPKPVASLAQLPPTNVLGQSLYNNFLGQPPYDISGEVRTTILPHLTLDVQRTYYFNFGNLRWTPQFVVQVIPQ